MTVIDLISELNDMLNRNEILADTLVMVEDCVAYRDTKRHLTVITEYDADNHADCEGLVGEQVFVL